MLSKKISKLLNICDKKTTDEGEYMLHKYITKIENIIPKNNKSILTDLSISDYFVCFTFIEGKNGEGYTLLYNIHLNDMLSMIGDDYQDNLQTINDVFGEKTKMFADGVS